jgi:monothiol glutaredoxin
MTDSIREEIDKLVHEHDIVLFMKGTPQLPQCGFSQQVAAILDHYRIPYIAVNVLLDQDVREGIKQYTDWPTIPQLYVKGKFVGGCDIVSEMHESGELDTLLTPLKPQAEE